MPRSTEETLKQIQKQGLSISIVSTENSRSSYALDSSGSKEVKTKQSASIDKTPKPTTRSLVVTENKPTLVQSKPIPITTSELRSYTGQTIFSSNQSSPVESKMQSGNKKGTIFPPALETRAFGSQSWSNPSTLTTEKKGSGGFNRIGQPDNKSSGRVSQNSTAFSESKTPNVRANQNILQLTDGKSQNRNNQSTSISECKVPVSSCSQSQLSFEGKLTGNQGRNTPSSPPLEKKILNSTQVRSSQNFSAVHENKNSASQRTANQLLNNNQVKVIQNKSADMKTPNQIRVQQSPNLRSVKHISIEKVQTTVKSVNEQPSVDSPVSERSMNNPFRVASTTLGKKVSNSEEKSSVKLVSQSVVSALSENNSSALSKISQNLSVHVENKANSQAVKVSSVSSESSQKPSVSSDHSPSSPMSPPTTIAPGKRIVGIKRSQPVRIVTQNSPVAAKKKCIKRAPPGVPSNSNRLQTNSRTNVDPSNSNSEENTPKEKFFKMNLTPGLTITPVNANLKGGPNSRPNAPKGPIPSTSAVTHCPSCNEISVNLNFCDSCNAKIPANSQQISVSADSFVYTKKTTSIHKKVYSFQFQKSVNKIMVETNPLMQVSPRSKGRPRTRRKFVEPVCYTLSSDDDDEEPAPYHPIFPQPQLFPVDSEGSKSEHSSTSEILQEDNQEFDDQQFPGVTEINEQIEIEEPDEEEMMDYECEEEEEIDESIEEEEEEDEEIAAEDPEPDVVPGQKPTDYPLRCRSIRIGAYKIHPGSNRLHVPVSLAMDSMTFRVPMFVQPYSMVPITIRGHDMAEVIVHFGRCLPIIYVRPTQAFGEQIKSLLGMSASDAFYFDATSKDERIHKLTFLIDNMTDEQRQFLRQVFPGDKMVKEIDQKIANEILVRSTPSQAPTFVKIQCDEASIIAPIETPVTQVPSTITITSSMQAPSTTQIPNVSPQISVTKVTMPPQPVIKLMTYPPPPQTGGIVITNEDLVCLNDGEFLNDAIIDFYLKYIFNEKLTASQREKTHIFSSFFYPRLTHKPDRQRPGDDSMKTVQVRRHNQVKTWTRHVDIFSKDFIIIPVNQNVHWFLAIICYPGKVPEVSNTQSQSKSEIKVAKSNDSVTSTIDQEVGNKSVIIKELNCSGDDVFGQDDTSDTSDGNSSYLVEEPPDSDEASPDIPDSSTHPDGQQRREMPCICIFDSLSGPNRWRIPATLREYLEMEWKMKKGTKKIFDRNTMQGFIMKCPQQNNFSDCGTYLLQFVESFFENPIPYFANPMPDLTNWFSEPKISKKRQELRDLILSIHQEQTENAPTNSNVRKESSRLDNSVRSSPVTVLQCDNR